MILKETWVDRFVGMFSTKRKLNRLENRLRYELLRRKFDGAGRGKRTENWFTTGADANTEIAGGLKTLRNRSRDLVRNDAIGARAVQAIANNVVGTGIMTQFSANSDRFEEEVQSIWDSWAGTTNIDYNKFLNFNGIQNLVMRQLVESGEALIRIVRTRTSGKTQIPYRLQVLEGDYIDDTKTGVVANETAVKNGNNIIQGIEVDKNGKRVAYHLYKSHPGDTATTFSRGGREFETVRVPASEVIHIYRIDRPGQIRGIPWFAPVMIRMRDLDEYKDAALLQQKIASCYSGFIKTVDNLDNLSDEQCEVFDKLQPGTMTLLPQGTDITFANPPKTENYNEYVTSLLHDIAAGLGISYEILSGDLKEVNFSSARMGWLEFHRNVETWRKQILEPMLLEPVVELFMRGLAISTMDSARVETLSHSFTAPRREMIDPTKEVPAMTDAIRSGLLSHRDAVKQLGKDPTDHYREIQSDNSLFDEKGFIFDSDARKTQGNGAIQKTQNSNND